MGLVRAVGWTGRRCMRDTPGRSLSQRERWQDVRRYSALLSERVGPAA